MSSIRTRFGIKLPSSIQIGAAVYTIILAPLYGKRTCAVTDHNKQTITIDMAKHTDLHDLLDTYWHEVSHVIKAQLRTKMSHEDIVRDAHGRTQALLALVNAQ